MSNAIGTIYSRYFVLWMIVFIVPFGAIVWYVQTMSVASQWAFIAGIVFSIGMDEVCDRLTDRAVEGDNNE